MLINGVVPDEITVVSLLYSCSRLEYLDLGRWVHGIILKRGILTDFFVAAGLIDMYAKCRCLDGAYLVFNKMTERNVGCWNAMIDGFAKSSDLLSAKLLFDRMDQRDIVSWNVMISAYVSMKLGEEAISLFKTLLLERELKPNDITMLSVVSACAKLGNLKTAKWVHGFITEYEICLSIGLYNALIDMYSRCGSLELSLLVFNNMPQRDHISWNTMISNYVREKHFEEALSLFRAMRMSCLKPDEVSIGIILKVFMEVRDFEMARSIYAHIEKIGMIQDGVIGNSLIDMYAKRGPIDDASKLFFLMPSRDIVCWNTMIAGYLRHGDIEFAQTLFDQMPSKDLLSWNTMITGYAQFGLTNRALALFSTMPLKPDKVTTVSLISACSQMGDAGLGSCFHAILIRTGIEHDLVIDNALITCMLSAGAHVAHRIFASVRQNDRNVSTWSAMISGLAMHGHAFKAIELFHAMQKAGCPPDDITFVALLSACSHAGLIEEGEELFNSMSQVYGITPSVEHYGCMVDLLGRAGLLDKAVEVVRNMPMKPEASVLSALLGACRIHGNTELAESVIKRFELEEIECEGIYLLISNVYAAASKWNEVGSVRKLMRVRGFRKKEAGHSLILRQNESKAMDEGKLVYSPHCVSKYYL
ncbi:LOW QUALITY PROTEIN: pentatricopeptide repeat-containing protein At3g22690-like [Amborella trichopoda]|uniref:LOW QUALITY PROTEIN: pentatricopeptide repeat-containing protein At3g22690-like n=1 Tax=Amborella trichopoda TaxID=13333 RepID=UPI0009BDD6F6|nr:LOW QUALITY PROTEIN: pentatricopeptide repeat-containing protein At3g22690-like [Amborella trichopoda]|eukprot:XP_011622362.2 LOW QUALITY PROTEIN: pentatricopeptide repeat-containing protein At3g22690-like [Amborella trichopoda]